MFLYLFSASLFVTSAFLLPVTMNSLSLTALAQTQTNQDQLAEANRLYQQGIELLRKRQLPQAVEKFQEVLVICQEIKHYHEQSVRYLIGSIYEQLGQSDLAQKYHPPEYEPFRRVSSDIPEEERLTNEELLNIEKQIKNQAYRLYQQGIQQLRQDRLQQALQTFQQVLANRELGVYYSTRIKYQIASIYEQLGESEQAENLIGKFNFLAPPPPPPTPPPSPIRGLLQSEQRDDDEDPKTRANRLFKEGSQWLEKGELVEARIAFEQVLGIRKKLGDRKGQTETLLLLAKVHEQLGNKNWAEQLNRRAREIGLR